MKTYEEMVTKKSWEEFRTTGLVLFINNILHVFGWAIVFEVEKDTETVTAVYPARVKFRGFGNEDTTESHQKIAKWISDNSDDLLKEASE
jgi:hypothetical protein